MTSKALLVLGVLTLLVVVGFPLNAQSAPTAESETMMSAPKEGKTGRGTGYDIPADGLQSDGVGLTAVYTSATITAPFPFNALGPRWQANLPEGAQMELLLRTAKTAGIWSDWADIHAHGDWTLPEDEIITGDMLAVPAADETHEFVQVQIILTSETAVTRSQLQTLSLTFIDSTGGPTIAEMQAQQAQLDAEREETAVITTYPRPSVISRAVWCIYDTCDDVEDLVYEPVTHLIVHHTVTENGYPNAANVVRAIYLFHRDTQDWGDIGYNYLIDRDGVIFEGHMNEDYLNLDVVGIHAGGANSGSLGTALIGTFTTPDEYQEWGTPPAAMLNSLANLFAWKADQRDIEIYDASRPVNMGWGLPHIMGHRDVYGGTNTLCPGGNAQAQLPWLRTAVAQRIGQVSPFTFVSETSSAFTHSNAYWYVAPQQCGWQGHAYYTWSTTNPAESTNWGEWRLTIPTAGYYEIQVYAPYCDTDNSETNGARYEVRHDGIAETVVVSHDDNVGLWMSLGTFNLPAGSGSTVYLSDLTTTDDGVGVWFDDVRFRRVTEITISGMSPANGVWVNQAAVDFSWEFNAPTLVQSTQVEVATDAAFTHVIAAQSWPTAVTNFSHTFAQDYPVLYWRVKATNQGGVLSTSPTASFALDATPPESSVSELRHHVVAGYFDVFWQGTDALSGVSRYTVEYRAEGEATWTTLLANTAETTAVFTPPNPAALYWLRSQAVDEAGNVEAASGGDMRTDQASIIFNPQAQIVTPANASWQNNRAVGFSWQLAEIDDVQSSLVEIATDAAFNQPVASETINGSATSHTITLTQDYARLYWRVTVDFTPPLPGLTSTVTSQAGSFALAPPPPDSGVPPVPPLTATPATYLITWSGQDALSGVTAYTVDYQAAGDAGWTRWLTETNQRGYVFTLPTPGQIYYFRSQARDLAGNLEAPHPTADIGTDQAIDIPHAIMLPILAK